MGQTLCSRIAVEMPRYRLLECLASRGYEGVVAEKRLKYRRFSRDPFQELAVDLLAGNGVLREEERGAGIQYLEEHQGRIFLVGGRRGLGEKTFHLVYSEEEGGVPGDKWRDCIVGPRSPLIVVDLGALSWHRHGSELSSLRRQLGSTLGVVREYLWDAHLVVTSTPPGAEAWLRGFMGSRWTSFSMLHAEEYLKAHGIGAREAIALDPGAQDPLSPEEVLGAKAFILGGIVDKIPWKGLTSRLLDLTAPHIPRRKLVLRGSSVGVPHRVNIVAWILLAARYRFCGDTEKAIVRAMARRDRRMRLHRELLRATRGGRLPATRSLYQELAQWLPITWRDYVAVARMIGARVEDT